MLHAEDYVNKVDDSKVMRTLARDLREEPEEDRFQFIQDMLAHPSGVGAALRLANTSLRKREFLERVFERCLDQENWRWLPLCLDCVVPRIGLQRVITILKLRLEQDPGNIKNISLARYYLGSASGKARASQALEELDAALSTAHAAQEGLGVITR